MTSPVNANLIAWNSVAMSGGSMQNGKVSYLLPNEAPKVGINVSTDVEVAKTVCSRQDERRRAGSRRQRHSRDARVDGTDHAGRLHALQVNLNNKGPAVASGMNVTELLPAGVEYVSSETRICQDGATNPCTGPSRRSRLRGRLDTDWTSDGVRRSQHQPQRGWYRDAVRPREGQARHRGHDHHEHGDPG